MPAVRPRCGPGLVLALAVLLVAGCTDGEGGGTESESPSADTLDTGSRPEIDLPEGPPPEGLTVDDLVEGDGPQVADDVRLTLHYVALTWSGDEVTSTWDRGQPLIYRYGDGRWVEGWNAGLEGMHEGGRRRIVVPAEFGYGQRSVPGVPAGETLVFVVDLLEVG